MPPAKEYLLRIRRGAKFFDERFGRCRHAPILPHGRRRRYCMDLPERPATARTFPTRAASLISRDIAEDVWQIGPNPRPRPNLAVNFTLSAGNFGAFRHA